MRKCVGANNLFQCLTICRQNPTLIHFIFTALKSCFQTSTFHRSLFIVHGITILRHPLHKAVCYHHHMVVLSHSGCEQKHCDLETDVTCADGVAYSLYFVLTVLLCG